MSVSAGSLVAGRTTGMNLLVTGAAGHLGSTLLAALPPTGAAAGELRLARVVALDVRDVPGTRRRPGVEYRVLDIRSRALADVLADDAIHAVVHLAAIVDPGRRPDRAHAYSVDVLGTRNLLEACIEAGVRRIVVASSGAAYGYHADNPPLIDEDTPLRGNTEFAYSDHKRQVEELLAACRASHPGLGQLVLRIGTVLGESVRNQITALFERRFLVGLRGSESPFVFAWDEDVAGAILHGLAKGRNGIYNLAGDGVLTLSEIAELLGKPCVRIPPGLLHAALALLHPIGLTRYGPEQVDFLRYRPVLDNRRLRAEFGYQSRWSSRSAFEHFARARGLLPA